MEHLSIYGQLHVAVDDNRQRWITLLLDDCLLRRSQPLAYGEAVRLINPVNPELNGEVTSLSTLRFLSINLKHQIFKSFFIIKRNHLE